MTFPHCQSIVQTVALWLILLSSCTVLLYFNECFCGAWTLQFTSSPFYQTYLLFFFFKPLPAWPLMAFKLAKLGTKEVGRVWVTEVLVGHVLHLSWTKNLVELKLHPEWGLWNTPTKVSRQRIDLVRFSLQIRGNEFFFIKGQEVNVLDLWVIQFLLQVHSSVVADMKVATDNTYMNGHGHVLHQDFIHEHRNLNCIEFSHHETLFLFQCFNH